MAEQAIRALPRRMAAPDALALAEPDERFAVLDGRLVVPPDLASLAPTNEPDPRDELDPLTAEALRRQPYDLVLMDVQMPEMDGMEATGRIRRDFPQSQQPFVVAVTAAATRMDRERCLAAGMDDHLAKPFQLKALIDVLMRGIERKSAELGE